MNKKMKIMKKETWKIRLFVMMHTKYNVAVTKEMLLDQKFSNKEEACNKIKQVKDDLYGFEIPVRITCNDEDLVIRPKKCGLLNLVKIKKIELVPGDLMDIEFLAEEEK